MVSPTYLAVHLIPMDASEPCWRCDSMTAPRLCGRCRKSFPGDPTLPTGVDLGSWYCAPCHDARGDGKGILATRGNVPTTSMHAEKVLTAGDGHLFEVVTNGLGLMPAYRWPIPPADRWAIVAHVREMQRARQQEASQP